ncbi:hypothetical protein D9756_002935 [Leucocoprinus leucothites]|uniref:Wax synthase domain-containing protein n=1 Tax=Leucocoprinus leucothites TaxID=201217 RepID=A0A8H5LJC3_9AGAR|nr:hypothetical protein D9756_002935 [Leucoagaricus leucothites]
MAVTPETTRSPFPIPLFILLESLILLGYALRPSWYRPLLFIPIPFIVYHLVFHTTTGTIADVGLGSTLVIHFFFAFDRLVLTDIQKTFHRIGEKPGEITSASFLDRLAWSLHLHCSPRGVGWNFEVPHIPKNPPSPDGPGKRKAYVVSRLGTVLICAAVQGASMIINSANPALVPGTIPLHNQPLYVRVLSILGLGAPGLAYLNLQHCVVGILLVGSGISEPEDWPPLFGSLSGMYSVQNFWRNVWHQMLRRIFLSTANFIIHTVLRFPHGTSSKSSLPIGLLKLHTVFLVSGIIHYAGEFMMLGYGGNGALLFFVVQAWAITLEVVVRYLITESTRANASEKPPTGIRRLLGYVWVFCWFVAVTPLIQQPMVEAGLFLGHENSALAQKVGRWLGLDVI